MEQDVQVGWSIAMWKATIERPTERTMERTTEQVWTALLTDELNATADRLQRRTARLRGHTARLSHSIERLRESTARLRARLQTSFPSYEGAAD